MEIISIAGVVTLAAAAAVVARFFHHKSFVSIDFIAWMGVMSFLAFCYGVEHDDCLCDVTMVIINVNREIYRILEAENK